MGGGRDYYNYYITTNNNNYNYDNNYNNVVVQYDLLPGSGIIGQLLLQFALEHRAAGPTENLH